MNITMPAGEIYLGDATDVDELLECVLIGDIAMRAGQLVVEELKIVYSLSMPCNNVKRCVVLLARVELPANSAAKALTYVLAGADS